MLEFARVCDIWKSFWQALGEEVLALGGSTEVLERLAKKELRPAIRKLARALVGMVPSPVRFDVQKAQDIWKSAALWENPQLPYCRFTLQNALNQTKLVVAINRMSNQVQVDVDLATLDCPTLGQSRELPHQYLMHLGLRAGVIGEVVYDQEHECVKFVLKSIPEMDHRCLYVYNSGKVVFTDW